LAYDARRDQLVVFGGTAPDLGDTWVWNGTVWDEVTPLTGPSARIGPSMSYDPVRERVVMVGGNANSTPLADVWEWDGSSWGERGSIAPLLPRGSAAATYDPIRQVTSLVGGVSYFLGRLDETLEWNGQVIDLRAVPATAGPRSGAGLAYHAIEHALVTFGGDAGGNPFDDTWVRVYESYDHPAERCAIETEDSDGDGLAGCADPDCYGRCAPLCLPGATCPSDAPRCGDGTCSPVEDHLICDVDC
jgi:hypothetical protein